jgi:hypothetical protein
MCVLHSEHSQLHQALTDLNWTTCWAMRGQQCPPGSVISAGQGESDLARAAERAPVQRADEEGPGLRKVAWLDLARPLGCFALCRTPRCH